MTDPIAKAHAAVDYMYSESRRQIREKNRQINDLKARNGELQRALQAKAGEVVRAKRQAVQALDAAANEAERESALAVDLAAVKATSEEIEKQLADAIRERDEALRDSDRAGELYENALDAVARSKQTITDLRAQLVEALDRAEQPRPFTPDDITDEMLKDGEVVWSSLRSLEDISPLTVIREIITAALTVPTRPEGAEDIEALIEASLPGDALSDAQVQALADYLAPRLTDPTIKEN